MTSVDQLCLKTFKGLHLCGTVFMVLTWWVWHTEFDVFFNDVRATGFVVIIHYFIINEILDAPSACIFLPQWFCGTRVPLGRRSSFILNRTVHGRTTKRNSEHVKLWAARDLQVPEVLVFVQVFVVDGGEAALVDNVAVRRQKIQGDTGNHTQRHFNTDTGTEETWTVV